MMKLLVLLFFMPMLIGINNLTDGFRIPAAGGETRIYAKNGGAQGACYYVKNHHASSELFVPTKTTTEWSSFFTNSPNFVALTACQPKSCLEIKNLMTNPTDGLYTIDSDGAGANASYQAYCDMTTDGGGWTRVFYNTVSGALFANNAEALSSNQSAPLNTSKYSILNRMAGFFRAGKFEMKMNWPASPNPTMKNWWTQTSEPTSELIAGYTAVSISTTANGWGGLEPNAPGVSLMDGSVGGGGWFYAIGSQQIWGSNSPGLPASDDVAGAPDTGVPRVELWVK